MISMTRTLLILGLASAPATLAHAVQRREVGAPLNFDIRIWSKEITDSMIPTAWYAVGENRSATSNAQDYTVEGTNPDIKRPNGSTDDYFIIGQIHFNEVPGSVVDPAKPLSGPRKMYLFTGQQTPGQATSETKEVYCDITFENDPGMEDLNWFLRAADPFDGKKPEDMAIVCSGDAGVINEGDTVEVATTNPDGASTTSTASEIVATTMA